MNADEQAIRDLVANWLSASGDGDVERVLELMDDDVVFLQAGQPTMRGRAAFAAAQQPLQKTHRIEARSEIQEIRVFGDWAYCWNHLDVVLVPLQSGALSRRAGHVLSILHRQGDGTWVLFRDANLMIAGAPIA